MSRETAQRHAREANEVLDSIEREGRQPSAAETRYVQQLIDRAKAEAGLAGPKLGGTMSNTLTDPRATFQAYNDPGAAFVQSAGYKAIKNGNRPQQWSTGVKRHRRLQHEGNAPRGRRQPRQRHRRWTRPRPTGRPRHRHEALPAAHG